MVEFSSTLFERFMWLIFENLSIKNTTPTTKKQKLWPLFIVRNYKEVSKEAANNQNTIKIITVLNFLQSTLNEYVNVKQKYA